MTKNTTVSVHIIYIAIFRHSSVAFILLERPQNTYGKLPKMFRLGKKQPPASSVCYTFRDVLWFSCVDNSSKHPLANHSWNYQTYIYNTKNSGGNHCNWGLRMAQRKKKIISSRKYSAVAVFS